MGRPRIPCHSDLSASTSDRQYGWQTVKVVIMRIINQWNDCQWKLVISIILLILKLKNLKYVFMHNLIGHIRWKFYEDDVIIVTSRVCRTQSISAVFCPLAFFHHLPSVKHHSKSGKMSKFNNETHLHVIYRCFIFFNVSLKFIVTFVNKFLNALCKKWYWLLSSWLHLHVWCNFCHPACSLLAQTDSSHWRPNTLYCIFSFLKINRIIQLCHL